MLFSDEYFLKSVWHFYLLDVLSSITKSSRDRNSVVALTFKCLLSDERERDRTNNRFPFSTPWKFKVMKKVVNSMMITIFFCDCKKEKRFKRCVLEFEILFLNYNFEIIFLFVLKITFKLCMLFTSIISTENQHNLWFLINGAIEIIKSQMLSE